MRLIFNNLTDKNHLSEIKIALKDSKNIEKVIISSAFSTEEGIYQIEEELKSLNTKVDLFLGYNNGTTDKKTLVRSLKTNCNLYAVGLKNLLYHPKIYFIKTNNYAEIIIGSANLTLAGLEKQYEAGIYCKLDLKKDCQFIDDIFYTHKKIKESEETTFITSIKDINQLDKKGFLKKTTISSKRVSKQNKLNLQNISHRKTSGLVKKLGVNKSRNVKNSIHKNLNRANYELVWRSKPLTNRSLNIKDKPNTNLTGAMNLGLGDRKTSRDLLNIEKVTETWNYFPEKVFKNLKARDGKKIGRYMFNIEIFGKSQGDFELEVVHEPKLGDTKSGKQNNTANSIRWGEATEIVNKPEYRGKILTLYKSKKSEKFIISID